MGDQRTAVRDGRSRPAAGGTRPRAARPQHPSGGRPRLTRARSRAGEVVARTTGMLGLSSTKRAAILAIVVCALALTVAVPLHNYVSQRQELARVTAQQEILQGEVAGLSAQRDTLSDPAEIAAQARTRLGYVAPGETPYVVQLPTPPAAVPDSGQAEPGVPWFRTLWTDVSGGTTR